MPTYVILLKGVSNAIRVEAAKVSFDTTGIVELVGETNETVAVFPVDSLLSIVRQDAVK